MDRIEKYIYGIINSNGKELFGSCMPAEASVQAGAITACEEALSIRGASDAPGESKTPKAVYTISYQDISAVVSDSEIADYGLLLKDEVARRLIKHQRVIEKVMENFMIIPMRLGTFAYDADEVVRILAQGYLITKGIFNKVFDKIEIDVVAVWNDFNSVIQEVVEEKEIKELKGRLLANPNGITEDDQMKVGMMVKNHLDKKREKCVFEIQSVLKTISHDFRVHELMNDRMVINMAFLISKAKGEDFDRKVEELNTAFADKLNFRCVGPLPPYSFYTLEIKKMQIEEIDWARKKLGLNDATSKAEIKKAYQRLAFTSHPDKNSHMPGTEREFDDVNKAYRILIDYCEACEQVSQQDSFSLSAEGFKKNAILVTVRE